MRQTNLVIDGTALWCDLMETAVFGGTPRGGIRRLALSDADFAIRDWFQRTCTGLGCHAPLIRWAASSPAVDFDPVCVECARHADGDDFRPLSGRCQP